MKVSDAVGQRRSIRQFLDKPVPDTLLRDLLEKASRSPSGGNLQPWYVHAITGDSLTRLKSLMEERIAASPQGEGANIISIQTRCLKNIKRVILSRQAICMIC